MPERTIPTRTERLIEIVRSYYYLALGVFFLAVAFLFSFPFETPEGNTETVTDNESWGTMAKIALMGVISFGVGVRTLCLRGVKKRLSCTFSGSLTG